MIDIEKLPQKAQIWLSIIQFKYLGYHFQRMVFNIASIMTNEELSCDDKARELAAMSKFYDKFDQEIILKYVKKFALFDTKHWTKC